LPPSPWEKEKEERQSGFQESRRFHLDFPSGRPFAAEELGLFADEAVTVEDAAKLFDERSQRRRDP
jgi:hypothetical protein